ncbi:hypothetical protein TRICI_002151 [Trichomonascus ciferrii]|uniref:Invertebrate defensins family profile domain-containing protein n=1 Tax=Trichomonascus ciferrii TaxID=44093 RepID=A0A642V6L1_9ASCO|nr:hypothetical protein TRICI_002151 [Trichomonascus ciferrii]
MQFFKALLLFTAAAMAAPNAQPEAEAESLGKRGFGCPFDQGECHDHCVSIGKRAGYCDGAVKQTCTCTD